MTFNKLTCGTSAGNTGSQNCVEDFGVDKLMILCQSTTEIDTESNAILEATWSTLINNPKASRCYPLFSHFNAEPNPEDRVIDTGWDGEEQTVREGKFRATFYLEELPLFLQQKLRTHNGRKGLKLYMVTANGYIKGTSVDKVKFLPFTLSDFYVEPPTFLTGENINRTPVTIAYASPAEWADNGVWVKPTAFDPLLLDGIKDVHLSGTLGATGMTLTVTGAADSVGITGLVDANFDLHTDAAPDTPVAVTVGADNGDGTYTLTWADQTGSGAMTLTLFDQPIGTSGYEATDDTNGKVTGTL